MARLELDRARLEAFMKALAAQTKGPGTIFLTGGASALLIGWRGMTIDIDLKADPEPIGLFEAIVELKESLSVNVELASPEQFIPELPGWRERSPWCARHGEINFFHYDFYSQALAKLERRHPRDLTDVASMLDHKLIEKHRLSELFESIRPKIIRYPAIDPVRFAHSVTTFLHG